VRLSVSEAVALARQAGFSGPDLVIAVAVAMGESGLRTDARLATSREDSRGLWQINTKAHPWADPQRLYDPAYNAWAARQVWTRAGGSWKPWTVFTSGRYRARVPEVEATIAGGGVGALPSPTPSTTPGSGGGRDDKGSDIPIVGGVVDGIGGIGRGVVGGIRGGLDRLNPLDDIAEGVGKTVGRVAVLGVLLAGGVAMVVLGARQAVTSTKSYQQADAAAKAAVTKGAA
jgi:hypothetical protein